MASIIKVGEKWRALIRRKGHPSYCKTFTTKVQAAAWARKIESGMDQDGAPAAAAVLGKMVLVSDLIATYEKMREQAQRPILDTANENYELKRLRRELGHLDAAKLTPQDLVGYCSARAEDGAGPYTINMEVSKLGTVMRYASLGLKIRLPDVVKEARPLLAHLQLVGGGGKRERRPTEDELHDVLQWLTDNHGQVYADVVRFAVGTAMRRGEIVKVTWADLDAKKKMILVRDRKDPRKKEGNDQWVPLLGDMWELVQAQPKGDAAGRIFPIHPQTLSKYFKGACDALSILDLHFHDLRHEGTSRLFELGYQVQQVALVTGHKNWVHLKRYTNLRPEDLHGGPAGRDKGN